MKKNISIPTNPLNRFLDIYGGLTQTKNLFEHPSSLRFSTLTALSCEGDGLEVAHRIREKSEEIKTLTGWFGALNSPLRLIVSSILVLHGDSASDFLNEVNRVNEMFRKVQLRKGGIYETMAILMLRLNNELRPIEQNTVDRFKAIYEEMKNYHWWLTGPDDFPACAALCSIDKSITEIGSSIEAIYQALYSKGFSKGDPLQTAANLLYLSQLNTNEIASRYYNLSNGFKEKGVSIWQSDYDELAMLSFLDHEHQNIIDCVLKYRKHMKTLKPKPDVNITFNLASGLTFLELIQVDQNNERIVDAKALIDMQSIIQAQQAAAAAAASSAAAANAAST